MFKDLREPKYCWWPDTPLSHHTTLADFTAQPPTVFNPRSRLQPLPRRMPATIAAIPFLVSGYTLHVGHTWEILTVEGSEVPIAIYRRNYSMRVGEDARRTNQWDAEPAPGAPESPHRRKGLGVMMFVWRCEKRGQPPFDHMVQRNQSSWALRKKGHRLLVERALARGCDVPELVLRDYPELAG